MKERRLRYKIRGQGKECPKCRERMERREHGEEPKKTWYFTEWDYCKKCKHVQHYDEFKSVLWKEAEDQERFFNHI